MKIQPHNRSAPRTDLAVNHIVRYVSENPGVALPSVTALCAGCGVSRVTMIKALKRAAARQIVACYSRGYRPATAVSLSAPPAETPPPAVNRAKAVAASIVSDLNAQFLRRDRPLPRFKALTQRYGTSRTTLALSLRMLCGRGILERRGRGFQPTRAHAAAMKQSAILCIRFSTGLRTFSDTTPRSFDFWRAVERECHQRGLGFESVAMWQLREIANHVEDATDSLAALMDTGRFIGVIFWALNADSHRMERVVAPVATAGVPLALLYEADRPLELEPLVASARRNSLIRIFLLGTGSRCGTEAATHLLNEGHRDIAFFALSQENARLAGARSALNLPGCSVRHYGPPFASEQKLNEAVPAVVSPELKRGLDQLADAIKQLGSGPVSMFGLHDRFIHDATTCVLMQPHFSAAHSCPEHTAWLCYTDFMALLALDFLGKHTGPGFRRPAVMGFDDSLEAVSAGLTSYNFNAVACATAIMDHLVEPAHLRQRSGGPLIEVPGYISVRASTQRYR